MNDKFVTLSWDFIRDDRTTMQEKLILCEIQNLTMLEYGCIANNEHFASLMGIQKEAVSRLINSLVKKGFILSEIKNGSRNFSRRLTINKMLFHHKQNVISPLTKCLETKGNILINIKSKEEKPRKEYSLEYLEIWEYYKITNKGDKRKAFNSYIGNKLNKIDIGTIKRVLDFEMNKSYGQRYLSTIFNSFEDSLEVIEEIESNAYEVTGYE